MSDVLFSCKRTGETFANGFMAAPLRFAALLLLGAFLGTVIASSRRTSDNSGGLKGHFRMDLGNASGIPPCSRPEIFSFPEGTLHTGKWRFSSKALKDPKCRHTFSAADPVDPRCTLQKITAPQARQCLFGKHIVLIGDSITRYMFESLVTLLLYGEYPDPTAAHLQDHPANVWMAEKGGCAAKEGFIRCDRYRNQLQLRSMLVDNRYMYAHGFNVSMFGYYNVARGHWPIGFHKRVEKYYKEKHRPIVKENGDWEGDLRTLAGVIAKGFGQVDVLFVNSGLWSVPEFSTLELALEQMRSVEPLVKDGRKPIWMATTVYETVQDVQLYNDTYLHDIIGYKAARILGWPILDRYGMVTSLVKYANYTLGIQRNMYYMDRIHFYPWVTREFDNVLLNMLCSVH